MSPGKVPTAQPVDREHWRCIIRSLSTQSTQVPMIQQMQKTVEILQVQFIDKVVEISEIMRKDKCQRSRRNGNSRKFTDIIVDVPVRPIDQCTHV